MFFKASGSSSKGDKEWIDSTAVSTTRYAWFQKHLSEWLIKYPWNSFALYLSIRKRQKFGCETIFRYIFNRFHSFIWYSKYLIFVVIFFCNFFFCLFRWLPLAHANRIVKSVNSTSLVTMYIFFDELTESIKTPIKLFASRQKYKRLYIDEVFFFCFNPADIHVLCMPNTNSI